MLYIYIKVIYILVIPGILLISDKYNKSGSIVNYDEMLIIYSE